MKLYAGIAILLFAFGNGFGQRFMHLTSNDGLPDNHARFFYQDNAGCIYVGTRTGLSRYDGFNFALATMEDSVATLPKEFSAMIETGTGFFTVASSGIYEYSRYNNKLKISNRLQLLDEACFVEFEKVIYCGNSAGLFQYDPLHKSWVNCNRYVSGITNIHIRDMIVSDENELLLGSNKGFFRFGSNMELLETDIGNDPYVHDINGIEKDANGGFWFSTYNNLYYRDSAFTITRDYRSVLDKKFIRCLKPDQSGRVWLGGEFGLVIIDPQNNSKIELYRDISLDKGLNDNAVYSIFNDRDDNMWVGTYFGGINLWNSTFDKFTTFFPGNSLNNLSGKVVREMQEDRMGNLWLALEDGGLNYLDLKTGNVKRFFYQKGNDYKNVHSLILDGDNLWVGSFNNGLECYSIEYNDNKPDLNKTASYLHNKMIFAISRNGKGKIYAGTIDGIYVLDLTTGLIQAYEEEIFKTRMVYTLKCISEDELLAGTLRNGLYYCNLRDNIIHTFSQQEEFASMQSISSIIKVDTGKYAITCTSGLYIFSNEVESLECIIPNQGVSEFRGVLIDTMKNFWVSSTNGLNCYNSDGELIRNYNIYDGLPENQFNFNSAFKATGNQMFFGTYNGLISFYPERLLSYETNIPKVSFTSYTVVGDDRSSLQSVYFENLQKELILKPYQTFLSLEFSSLAYTRSKDMNYEIRISGGSGNWDKMMNNRSITFTRLSKGWHKVEVRPVSEGSVYGPVSILNIYREPAVWQTNYAFTLYSLILILIFILVRRDFLRRQTEKNNLALERYEKENQKALNEQKMRFFLNVSHEFRTPLAIIHGTISNIISKSKVDHEVLSKLQTIQCTSDNLNKLVNDFIDYGKLDSGFKPVNIKEEPILEFIEKTCSMFDNWAEANQLTYHKNIQGKNISGYFDPEKLERIMYNLLSNAFKFNKSNGSVTVDVSLEIGSSKFLICSIEDTGHGIPADLLCEIEKHFRNDEKAFLSEKTIGLAYTSGLIKQMDGEIHAESEQGKGSRFTFRIPIDKEGRDFISQYMGFDTSSGSSDDTKHELKTKTYIRNEKRPLILIIDDNIDLLQMLKESLDSEYNVLTSESPKQALSLVLEKEVSLIICDIMMPEMNGFEVIETLQSNILTSHIPVIILTAASEKNIELKGYMKGAVSYLAKPFKNDELILKMNSILSFRRELIKRYRNESNISFTEIVCSRKDEEFLEKAVKTVSENIENFSFDVDQFCSDMGASRTLLHTKLKNIAGLSTTEFIRDIRLKQAYVYLKKGEMTVSEVSIKCGFNDSNYFSKCFKKKFGFFPSKLNKQYG